MITGIERSRRRGKVRVALGQNNRAVPANEALKPRHALANVIPECGRRASRCSPGQILCGGVRSIDSGVQIPSSAVYDNSSKNQLRTEEQQQTDKNDRDDSE